MLSAPASVKKLRNPTRAPFRLVSTRTVHILALMLLLAAAAAPTALEKLKQIPPAFWLKVGIAVLALVVVVIALRKLAGMNKVVMAVVVLIILTTIGFHWIYERNEPAWATPVVEKLAGFFPSKGTVTKNNPTKP